MILFLHMSSTLFLSLFSFLSFLLLGCLHTFTYIFQVYIFKNCRINLVSINKLVIFLVISMSSFDMRNILDHDNRKRKRKKKKG